MKDTQLKLNRWKYLGLSGSLIIAGVWIAYGAIQNCLPKEPPSLPFPPRRPDPPSSDPGHIPNSSPSVDINISSELMRFLFYLLIAILVALAFYWLSKWALARRDQALPSLTEPSDRAPTTTEEALKAAQTKALQEDYRLALRHLHTAALIHLDRLGFLTYEPTNTDWEHLRALRAKGHEGLHTELFQITELVQRKWYGIETASAADFQTAQRVLQPILARENAL